MITDKFSTARAYDGPDIAGTKDLRSLDLQDVKDDQLIIDWLSPVEYASQQSDFIAKHQEGTGTWLLHSDQFQDWINQSGGTLFCPGIPGAGKTILTSIVIDHICSLFQNDPSIGVAYLYCNSQRESEQKPGDLLATLIKQFVQGQPRMPDSLDGLYKHHENNNTRPSLDDILNVLHSVVADFSRVFIIVDGLDQCQFFDGCRKRFLSEIFNLQKKTKVNFFATSRFMLDLKQAFQRSISLEILATEHDIRRYLEEHILRLASRDLRSSRAEVIARITKAADGMYRHFFLHLSTAE